MSSEIDINSNSEYGNIKKTNKFKLSIKRKRGDSRGDSIEDGRSMGIPSNSSNRDAPYKDKQLGNGIIKSKMKFKKDDEGIGK
jgi:hypothetical protein